MTKQVEVLIIGSGFGGAVAAQRLAAAGREVVMLERGPWRDTVPNRSLGLKNLVPLPQGSKAFTHGLRNVGSHRFKKTFTFNKKGFIEAYAGQGINIICSSGVGAEAMFMPDFWTSRWPRTTGIITILRSARKTWRPTMTR